MAGMPSVAFVVAFIDAFALDEGLEAFLICSFVNGEAAFGALEIPRGLLKGVFISRLWMLLLQFKQLLDGCGSGDLLANGLVRPEIWFWSLMGQEFAILLEVILNDLNCEGLMNPGVACLALVAAPVGNPLVLVGLPWCLALVDEPFFVLLGGVSSSLHWLVVDVVLGIFKDLFKPGCCLFVDLHMVQVKGSLPVLSWSVVERGSSLICSERCISLAPAEMWFVGWCVWRPVVLVDVQGRDSLEELVVKALGQVFEPFSLPWVRPSLPHHS